MKTSGAGYILYNSLHCFQDKNKNMKKNMYLWVFITVAVIVCGIFFVMSRDISEETKTETLTVDTSINKTEIVQSSNNDEQKKADLTQINVDFEEDADDLADGIVDDAQFDDEGDVASLENEVY